MIEFVEGDIFEVEGDVLCHQVNCFGVMGAGIAKKIRDKYPMVFDFYKETCYQYKGNYKSLLGICEIVDIRKYDSKSKFVANLYGQQDIYPRNEVHTDYDALGIALQKLYVFCLDNDLNTILIPDMIGCGLAGGDRNVVLEIIKKIFENDSKITVKIVKYV